MTEITPTIVPVDRAAKLLSLDEARLRTWLRDRGLLLTIAGQERVSLRAIEALVEQGAYHDHDNLISTTEAANLLGVSRSTLERLVDRAPHGLPGGPTDIGSGRRRHLRWDPSTLRNWASAVRATSRAPRKSSRRPTRPQLESRPVDWSKDV